MTHRWSHWPGAWGLDCGKSDPLERIMVEGLVDDEENPLPGALTEEDLLRIRVAIIGSKQ